MRHRPLLAWVLFSISVAPPAALAQSWNSEAAQALVRRATLRRSEAAADTALVDYTAQAHGFLFFLGQFGEGLAEPPRLITADQLELEVYWKAPDLSKQRIIGWRNKAELPVQNAYHLDHLGIIPNNFGAAIRLGEGDEVRDVPHPLSPGGIDHYDYALGDTTTITLPERVVRVVGLEVRPKQFDQPAIVGTLYVDAQTADLVRLTFSFTPKAYLDSRLEDVSIVLDNALWEDRFWLPYRQEIEIRRRVSWLDMPARGTIRGRWEVDGYRFNVGLAASWFRGSPITALPKAERDSFPWHQPLEAAMRDVAEPVRQDDLDKVRSEIARVAGAHALAALRSRPIGARGVSDLVHANRVEGLALGTGAVLRGGGGARELRAMASYGFADRKPKGTLSVALGRGRGTARAEVYRAVRDVGDVPVIAPLLNSLSSQELGDDYGDYYLASGGRIEYTRRLGARGGSRWTLGLGREAIASLAVRADPASGTFRPNPALGGPAVEFVTLALERADEGLAAARDLSGMVALEAGRADGGASYTRAFALGRALVPLGRSRVLVEARGGLASAGLPPYRTFVLGGRGSLLGDPFRRWGGRRMALLDVEWRLHVPFPSLSFGPAVQTPRSIVLAPFAAAGWADEPVFETPWAATPGVRVTVGLALEWLGAFRVAAGMDTRVRQARFAIDVTRDFWSIL